MSELHRVELPAYAGPMDLLLYLVKRHEIDLNDIPMSTLVEQYMAHMRTLQTIDVDRAGDFLVMAATLVEVKSRTLAAHHQQLRQERDADEAAGGDPAIGDAAGELEAAARSGEVVDPRLDLVQQLLAYKRFRDAAHHLEDRAEEWDSRIEARAAAPAKDTTAPDPDGPDAVVLDLEDVNILDLSAAFGRVMESIGHLGNHQVTYDDTPISLHAEDIADRLKRDGRVFTEGGGGDGPVGGVGLTLVEIFEGRDRGAMIGLFLATLELVRQRRILVRQPPPAEETGRPGEIRLVLNPEAPADDAFDLEAIDRSFEAPIADADGGGPMPESDAARTPDLSEPAGDGNTDAEAAFDPDAYEWPDEATRLRAERRVRLRKARAESDQAGESEHPLLEPDNS